MKRNKGKLKSASCSVWHFASNGATHKVTACLKRGMAGVYVELRDAFLKLFLFFLLLGKCGVDYTDNSDISLQQSHSQIKALYSNILRNLQSPYCKESSEEFNGTIHRL